jgi:hypothetical protein
MLWAGLAQAVYRLAKGWTIRGSYLGGDEIFRNRSTVPGAHPASYMGTGSFLWVKRPGRGVNYPQPYSAEVEERVGLYINATSGPSWYVRG